MGMMSTICSCFTQYVVLLCATKYPARPCVIDKQFEKNKSRPRFRLRLRFLGPRVLRFRLRVQLRFRLRFGLRLRFVG